MGENNKYKTNVKAFVMWLKSYMVGYGEYEPLVASKPATIPKDDDKTGEKKKIRDKTPPAKGDIQAKRTQRNAKIRC